MPVVILYPYKCKKAGFFSLPFCNYAVYFTVILQTTYTLLPSFAVQVISQVPGFRFAAFLSFIPCPADPVRGFITHSAYRLTVFPSFVCFLWFFCLPVLFRFDIITEVFTQFIMNGEIPYA